MTSIVTASTLAALRSVTAVDLAGGLALVAILTFLALAIYKEVLSSSADEPALSLSRGLYIGIIPLGIAFVMIALAQLYHVVR
ncbi:MAG: hypothetical protein M1531_12700 [Chloroflexi bacterium]|nr:hypothetical protein [Chloroflexota bacterium]